MIKISYWMATQPIRACDIIYNQIFILHHWLLNQSERTLYDQTFLLNRAGVHCIIKIICMKLITTINDILARCIRALNHIVIGKGNLYSTV